jgi:hypothetical protein
MQAGRLRRLARLKAAGLKAPCGPRPGAPKRSKDKQIARAQRIIEQRQMEMAIRKRGGLLAPIAASDAVPAVQEKPWAQMSKAEKLESNADVALDVTRKILELGVDPEDPQTLKIVKDTALQIIGAAVRINETQAAVTAREQKRQEILDHMANVFVTAAKDKP